MNTVDLDLERAETQASPEQYLSERSSTDRYLTRGSTAPTARDSYWTTHRESGLEGDLTELSRIQTQRSQQLQTIGLSAKTKSSSRSALPGFGGGKPYPPPLPERDEYVVEFNGANDPLYPQNWRLLKKYVSPLSIP